MTNFFYKLFHQFQKLFYAVLLLQVLLNGCIENYDKDLMRKDNRGNPYYTQFGLLIHGPWAIRDDSPGYNMKLFLKQTEILSKGYSYTELQRDLVFEFYKNGDIKYWLKSENNMSGIQKDEKKNLKLQSEKDEYIKNIYTKGYWKANFKDSSLLIHFEERKIPDLNFKINWMGSDAASFSQIYFIDSLIQGKTQTLKKVNTFFYTHPFIRF